jgi:ABC-type spermidine/putrescine transport system permease subunit I
MAEVASPAATPPSQGGAPGWWQRHRDKVAERRGWYPKWLWPVLALPGTLWMLVLFALPFYATLAVGAGKTDPLFGQPLPIWNPFQWTGASFGYVLSQFKGRSGVFFTPAIHTLVYTLIATALCLVIGYPVAYCVARHAGKRKGLILILLLAPFFISYLMRMLAWVNLLQDNGMVNRFLMWIHVISSPVEWLGGKPSTVIWGLIYGYIPYMILPLFGSLDLIDKSLLEGARDLGARPFEVFRRITLPLSYPAILASTLIVSLPMLGDYYTNNLLSGSPRTTMIANQIDFLLHTQNSGPTIGAAMVFLLTIALIGPMIYYLWSVGELAEERDEGMR